MSKKDKEKNIVKLSRIRIDKYGEGVYIYMEAVVAYGCNIPDTINKSASLLPPKAKYSQEWYASVFLHRESDCTAQMLCQKHRDYHNTQTI